MEKQKIIMRKLKKKLTSLIRTGIAVLSTLGIMGCTIAKPFSGPGYQSGRVVTGPDTVIIGLTHAVTGEDSRLNDIFFEYVGKVEDSLADHKGFIGYSIRRELLGNQVWTMTVWEDEESMENFVASDIHQEAIEKGMPALKSTRFFRLEADKAEVPISWEKAEVLLQAQGHGY